MNSPVKYIAEISPVRELSLLGTADLTFWKDRLKPVRLCPAAPAGVAQILVTATDARFRGIPFRELSVAVAVSRRLEGASRDGYYLVQAFNSSRLFARIERTCFSTPYYHGRIQLDVRLPASVQVARGNDVLFRGQMATHPREPTRTGDELWQGPIFLPKTGGPNDPGKVFFAKIAGLTRTFSFAPTDVLSVAPSKDAPILQWLIDSRFTGAEWAVRETATHAKSKTVKRSGAHDFAPDPPR